VKHFIISEFGVFNVSINEIVEVVKLQSHEENINCWLRGDTWQRIRKIWELEVQRSWVWSGEIS
jgi:hypothetical protein